MVEVKMDNEINNRRINIRNEQHYLELMNDLAIKYNEFEKKKNEFNKKKNEWMKSIILIYSSSRLLDEYLDNIDLDNNSIVEYFVESIRSLSSDLLFEDNYNNLINIARFV